MEFRRGRDISQTLQPPNKDIGDISGFTLEYETNQQESLIRGRLRRLASFPGAVIHLNLCNPQSPFLGVMCRIQTLQYRRNQQNVLFLALLKSLVLIPAVS